MNAMNGLTDHEIDAIAHQTYMAELDRRGGRAHIDDITEAIAARLSSVGAMTQAEIDAAVQQYADWNTEWLLSELGR